MPKITRLTTELSLAVASPAAKARDEFTIEQRRALLEEAQQDLLELSLHWASQRGCNEGFVAFEEKLKAALDKVGRASMELALAVAEVQSRKEAPTRFAVGDTMYRVTPPEYRSLNTWCGPIRDGRAYAHSIKRKGISVRMAADQWRQFQLCADRLLAGMPDDRLFQLRYEDLCAAPDDLLARLCAFLDIAPLSAPEVIHPGDHHILGNSMRLRGPMKVQLDEKWRDGLSKAEQDTVLAIAGTMNRRLGYED